MRFRKIWKDMSQEDKQLLCQSLGMAYTSVSSIACGHKKASHETAMKISRLTGAETREVSKVKVELV